MAFWYRGGGQSTVQHRCCWNEHIQKRSYHTNVINVWISKKIREYENVEIYSIKLNKLTLLIFLLLIVLIDFTLEIFMNETLEPWLNWKFSWESHINLLISWKLIFCLLFTTAQDSSHASQQSTKVQAVTEGTVIRQ